MKISFFFLKTKKRDFEKTSDEEQQTALQECLAVMTYDLYCVPVFILYVSNSSKLSYRLSCKPPDLSELLGPKVKSNCRSLFCLFNKQSQEETQNYTHLLMF